MIDLTKTPAVSIAQALMNFDVPEEYAVAVQQRINSGDYARIMVDVLKTRIENIEAQFPQLAPKPVTRESNVRYSQWD